jgi:hypothetical protein
MSSLYKKGTIIVVVSLLSTTLGLFGCTGKSNQNNTDSEAARSDGTWKIVPMPAETDQLECSSEFTPEEFAKIAEGLIPQEMEDKWYIHLEDNALYFNRS